MEREINKQDVREEKLLEKKLHLHLAISTVTSHWAQK